MSLRKMVGRSASGVRVEELFQSYFVTFNGEHTNLVLRHPLPTRFVRDVIEKANLLCG